jgi:hypothetical protein
MKTLKILSFIILLILAFSFLILALIQRRDVLYLNKEMEELIEINKRCNKIVIEYMNNFELLKNDSLKKIDIDSLYNSSEFLKSVDEYRKKKQSESK